MNAHADITQESKKQAIAKGASQQQSGSDSTFQMVDYRPDSISQRKLQTMTNSSPQVKQRAKLQAMIDSYSAKRNPVQTKANNTGLPDNLKTGIENLSGYAMDGVNVYYNSDKPAQLNAHTYAQGTNIFMASGQEKHLPHEAWHVVQQKQGRVKPTRQLKDGVNINDDVGLEKEAEIKGTKALQNTDESLRTPLKPGILSNSAEPIQRVPKVVEIEWEVTHLVREIDQSIFGGEDFEEGEIGLPGELSAGQRLIIDDQDIIVSRRGPNQENPLNREQNRFGEQIYEWYHVLFLNNTDVSSENLFVRGGTFAEPSGALELEEIEAYELSLQKAALQTLGKGTTWSELVPQIEEWWIDLKQREKTDTFKVAFKDNRMTARQINIGYTARGGTFNVLNINNPDRDREVLLERDVKSIIDRTNPENFIDRKTKNEKGLHDLSASLLDGSLPISGQLKRYEDTVVLFMPVPEENDLQLFSALKRLDGVNEVRIHEMESMLTVMTLAQASDMGTKYVDVSDPEDTEGDIRYGITGTIIRKKGLIGNKATKAELAMRRINALQYKRILAAGITTVNEVVMAYRAHESEIFPMFACWNEEGGYYTVVDWRDLEPTGKIITNNGVYKNG